MQQKLDYLKGLVAELEHQQHNSNYNELIKEAFTGNIKLNLEKKRQFVPKPDLRLNEFLAIKKEFCEMDFQQTNLYPTSLPMAILACQLMQRIGKWIKWL